MTEAIVVLDSDAALFSSFFFFSDAEPNAAAADMWRLGKFALAMRAIGEHTRATCWSLENCIRGT
jgi:hypothetical protein